MTSIAGVSTWLWLFYVDVITYPCPRHEAGLSNPCRWKGFLLFSHTKKASKHRIAKPLCDEYWRPYKYVGSTFNTRPIWGVLCQKQVSMTGTSNYIPQILRDVYLSLFLTPASCTFLIYAVHGASDVMPKRKTNKKKTSTVNERTRTYTCRLYSMKYANG